MQFKRTRAPGTGPRLTECRTYGDVEISTSLINGECPECSGQLSLTLRGEGGRFLKDLGPRPRSSSAPRPARTAGGGRP